MNNNNSGGGMSFIGLLSIAFIVLKLCDVIAWSWWWVLAPLWAPALFCVLLYVGIALAVNDWKWYKK